MSLNLADSLENDDNSEVMGDLLTSSDFQWGWAVSTILSNNVVGSRQYLTYGAPPIPNA